jgi:hypothetical protein
MSRMASAVRKTLPGDSKAPLTQYWCVGLLQVHRHLFSGLSTPPPRGRNAPLGGAEMIIGYKGHTHVYTIII